MCEECDCAAALILAIAIKRKREKRKLKRCQLRNLENDNYALLKVLDYKTPSDYKNNLRMDANTFEDLLARISPYITKQDTLMRTSIKARHRLSVALRFLINGTSYTELHAELGISALSIANIVMETCEAIIETLYDCMKFPSSQEEWLTLAQGFAEKWNFPNCLGVIDGRHIALARPPGSGTLYYNSQQFYSIVLMALVNANHEFVMVDVGSEGGCSSNDLCNMFWAKLQNQNQNLPTFHSLPGNGNANMPYIFVADEAFPPLEGLLKPFSRSTHKRNEIIFNYRLLRARRTATNVMGLLASRFKVLVGTINLPPQKVATITLACCYLHNFLIQKREKFYYSGGFDIENKEMAKMRFADWHNEPGLAGLSQSTRANANDVESFEVRTRFSKYFNTIGRVEWQDKVYYKRVKKKMQSNSV